MRRRCQFIRLAFRLLLVTFSSAGVVVGTSQLAIVEPARVLFEANKRETAKLANAEAGPTYQWNINDRELPLLTLDDNQVRPGLEHSLSYPIDQFRFLIFQSLTRDEEHARYLLPAISSQSKGVHFIEFESTGGKTYVSLDGSGLQLIDQGNLKTIRTSDGAKLTFVQYPDGEFRCASIKNSSGTHLNLLYAANGLTLRGVLDSFGRTIRFSYDGAGIASVRQTWMAGSTGFTKTWPVGDAPENTPVQLARYSHAVGAKVIPGNALVREYSAAMAGSDKYLAQVFSGPDAVAAGNGFEPAGLGTPYPLYRGDINGDDGKPRRGHLSYAIHIYGSPDGTGDSPLYVPAGFTSHSGVPSPKDAVVTFYYPRLGNVTDITLAVFHVADFQIAYEGDRIRIGNIGGPGGSATLYKHSHIEFYNGNTALPAAGSRSALRLEPSMIFSANR
ncbi:MAG: hypothetical protein ACT4OT_09100 [Acidobacteriota bacterium]